MQKLATTIPFLFFYSFIFSQITYVNLEATGNNDGSSWENAYTDLRVALENTIIGDVWIAEGTYYPTEETNRTIAFTAPPNVNIFGGFPNSGDPKSTDREWQRYRTIISGDIGSTGTDRDNSYSLLIMDFTEPSNTFIDGLYFEEANATGISGRSGAVNINGDRNNESKVIFSNCRFDDNVGNYDGGAVDCRDVMLEMKNCVFENNTADYEGGAIAVSSRTANGYLLNLENCRFRNNYARNGGAISASGIFNPKVKAIIKNCVFEDNISRYAGGAVESSWLSLGIYESTFSNNYARYTGGAIDFFNDHESTRDAQLLVINCWFEYNKSGYEGGAIGGRGIQRVLSSLFTENYATIKGGAINHYKKDSLVVVNCTFSKNISSGKGQAISNSNFSDDSTNTFIANSVFSENELLHDRLFDFSRGIAKREIHHSFIDRPNCPENIICGEGMIFNDESSLAGSLRPYDDSPLINAGKNEYLSPMPDTDLAGQPRIFGGTIDIGAYESDIENLTSTEETTQQSFKVFPNPSPNGNINLQIPNGSYQVMVNDLKGRRLFVQEVDANNEPVSLTLNKLQPGLYLVEVKNENYWGMAKVQVTY